MTEIKVTEAELDVAYEIAKSEYQAQEIAEALAAARQEGRGEDDLYNMGFTKGLSMGREESEKEIAELKKSNKSFIEVNKILELQIMNTELKYEKGFLAGKQQGRDEVLREVERFISMRMPHANQCAIIASAGCDCYLKSFWSYWQSYKAGARV